MCSPALRAPASHLSTTSPEHQGHLSPCSGLPCSTCLCLSRHNTAQDSQPEGPWGPGATSPRLAEPSCPAPWHPLPTRASSPPAQLKFGDSCSLGTARRGPACPAAHPHCHTLASGLEYGWKNPSLQELRDGAGSVQDRLSLSHGQGTDPQETRQDEVPAVGPALTELPQQPCKATPATGKVLVPLGAGVGLV